MFKKVIIFSIISISAFVVEAQVVIGGDLELNYANPIEYEVGGITVSGTQYLDEAVIVSLSGLRVGERIKVPGERLSRAVENLWKQGLFADVSIVATKIDGKIIFLELQLQERPRISKFAFKGVSKSDADKLRESIELAKGKIVTDNLVVTTRNKVRSHYIEKGFLNVKVNVTEEVDSSLINSRILRIDVEKGKKVKIKDIKFNGVTALKESQLRKAMKDTKEKRFYRIFSASKFLDENFEKDKKNIIQRYKSKGYRDAIIVSDTVYSVNEKLVNIEMTIDEGNRYYFGNIAWIGNTKYTDEQLTKILNVEPGGIYNHEQLEANLYMNPRSSDITSLYMDDGYLFFSVTPVEVQVENDTINLEMRIYEGKQAVINKVTVTGNTKTNDRVVLREIRTKPGQLFSRSDIIRTQRELAQLGYFDAEKLGVNPRPNPATGTVDIEYIVEEKPSDQVELSGGWGAGQLVGTLGLSFNNFSARNIFRKGSWNPLPSGDGQRLSVRAQSNGKFFQSYNASFTEPWLGGRRPTSLSFSAFWSIQSNGIKRGEENRQSIIIRGGSVGLGKRMQVPDDFFTSYSEVSFQNYLLNNYTSTFLFSDGSSNNFSLRQTFSRNSIDAPIFPRSGSQISLSVQATPPYSLFNNKDYSDITPQERYKWIEYHKWKFSASWFQNLMGKFVLNTKAQFGFLGSYDPKVGQSPFERFYLGGDGLSGFALDGRELIGLRGYENNSITPRGSLGNQIGGTVFDKYTLELRYPISLNPSATIFALVFAEGGNNWFSIKQFEPFDMKRSAGFGIRLFLPMFGLLGLDWGYGFDDAPGNAIGNRGKFHFSIGQQF
ncbi:MAG: outer membrane protein assembly factor BamA [Bacteroidia bacterium]